MRGSIRTSALLLALTAGGAARAAGGTVVLRVPSEYPTIQAAVDAAPKTGSVEIRVAAGTYRESVVATGFADLSVVGAPGARIESRGSEPAVTMCMSARMLLAGFTIDSDAVGVDFIGVGSATVRSVDVARSSTYGIAAEGSVTTTVEQHLMTGHSDDYRSVTTIVRTPLRIETSTITGTRGDAVRIGENADVVVTSTRIVAPTGDGIRADLVSSAVRVYSSTITGTGGDGVDVTRAALDMDDCSIVGANGNGVTVTDARGSISLTRVTQTGGHGIESRGIADVHVSECGVTATGGDGIRLAGDSVDSNTVSDTHGAGIFVSGRVNGYSLGVTGNRVSRTGTFGIAVGAAFTPVTHNVVDATGGDGISVGGSKVVVAENVVRSAGGRGIEVAGPDATVTGNTVERPAGDGIVVIGESAEVTSNAVTSAGVDGLRVESGLGVVRLNRVDDAAGDGVVLGDGWTLVEGQQVTGSGGDGISFVGQPGRAGATVTGNTVSSSQVDGIDLGATTRARVTKNVVTGCAECGIRLDDGAKRNRLARNAASGSGSFDLYESAGSGRNDVARSNRIKTRHRRGQR